MNKKFKSVYSIFVLCICLLSLQVTEISAEDPPSQIYHEDFESPDALDDWRIIEGNWFLDDGHLVIDDQETSTHFPRIEIPFETDSNWEVTFYQYWESGDYFENGLFFDVASLDDWQGYYFWPSTYGQDGLRLNYFYTITNSPTITELPFTFIHGQWYKFSVQRNGNQVIVFIDDQLVISICHSEPVLGTKFGFHMGAAYSYERILIDDLTIVEKPYETEFVDDFDDGDITDWIITGAAWQVTDGKLAVSNSHQGESNWIIAPVTATGNWMASVDVYWESGSFFEGIFWFDADLTSSPMKFWTEFLTQYTGGSLEVNYYEKAESLYIENHASVPFSAQTDQWYTFTVRRFNRCLEIYLDGTLMFSKVDAVDPGTQFAFNVGSYVAETIYFDNFAVWYNSTYTSYDTYNYDLAEHEPSLSTFAKWSQFIRTQYPRTREPIGEGRGGYYWAPDLWSECGYCTEVLCNAWGIVGTEIFNFPISDAISGSASISIKTFTPTVAFWFQQVSFDVFINDVYIGSHTSALRGLELNICLEFPAELLNEGSNNVFIVYDGSIIGSNRLTQIQAIRITYPIQVDEIPPVTTLELAGTLGQNNWYISDVIVTLTATDDLSGVTETWFSYDEITWYLYTEPFTVTNEGIITIYYYSIDGAENYEEIKSTVLMIDKTAPEIDAALVPIEIYSPEEGLFQVEFSATDNLDLSVAITAVIEVPLPEDLSDWTIKLTSDSFFTLKIDYAAKKLEIKDPHPEDRWIEIQTYGGITVNNDQQIKIKIKDVDKFLCKDEKGILKFEASEILLIVSAEDDAGNVSTISISPTFPT